MRLALLLLPAGLSACVWGVRHPGPVAVMPRPSHVEPGIADFTPPKHDFPSIGGDILKGTSPADQAALREKAETAAGPS